VEKAGYSWREWGQWILELKAHEKQEGYLTSYGAMAEGFEPPPIVKDRLGLSHAADSELGRYWTEYWDTHPDETPPE
jgi:hypothetical protein